MKKKNPVKIKILDVFWLLEINFSSLSLLFVPESGIPLDSSSGVVGRGAAEMFRTATNTAHNLTLTLLDCEILRQAN